MTSANNISWFHCGRCGSLFQSPIGESDDRLCPDCGCNPRIGLEPQAPEIRPTAQPVTPSIEEDTPASAERKKLPVRRRKRSYLMLYLIVGWLIALSAIIFGARHFWQTSPDDKPADPVAGNAPSSADVTLLNEAGPAMNAALSGFLAAGVPESRNQFVNSPVTTAARMERFYAMNPMDNIDPSTISLRGSAIVHIPGKSVIESQFNSTDGRLFDVAFIKADNDWKIDWDHFVRYSEAPWTLFLSGNGDAEGEFRVLARERLADERKDEDSISLVLYAPRFGHADDTGLQSPEFVIPRNSRDGRLLEAAFKLQKSGQRVFGVRLPSINPEGLIRIRAKIRRSGEQQARRFEIEKILACHWYSDDQVGIEPDASSPTANPITMPSEKPVEEAVGKSLDK